MSSKFHMLECNLQCDGIWRRKLCEGILSWGWFFWSVLLQKETQESLLYVLLSPSGPAILEYSKKAAVHKPGSGLSPDTISAGDLILYYPASRTVKKKKKCLLSKPLCGGYFAGGKTKMLVYTWFSYIRQTIPSLAALSSYPRLRFT